MNLLETLEKTLKKEPNYITDYGELKKWVIINKAQNYDVELIGLLLGNIEIKEKFFFQVKDITVFNQSLFIQFLEQKNYLNDSYTKYKNKIGLTIDGKYLKQNNEVSLVWPFKDCTLEGGQSFDEQEKEEIFFNEILAQDEITQLFEAKIFTNVKRYSVKGEKPFDSLLKNEHNIISENLLIKGNNLLALHSLKNAYANKIDLIYIDPPYNPDTKSNTFCYNNRFNESSWLTFIKNRLEVAKKLLTKNGALIVAIDKNEFFYLAATIKEIFYDYEIHCITIVHNPRGVQGTNFSYTHEYAIFVIPKGKKTIGDRKINGNEIDWSNLRNWGGESERTDAKNCFYPIIINPKNGNIEGFGDVCDDSFHPDSINEIDGDLIKIYPVDGNGIERKWRYARQSVEEIKNLLRARIKNKVWDIEIGKDFGQYKTVWYDSRYDANDYGTQLVKSLVPDCKFDFPKSLYNVYDCIYAVVSNNKNAIILDFFGGSGTTAHAVMELNKEDNGNRKFIICEQMNYVESVTRERIKNAMINISKQNPEFEKNYNFIYLELKKYNETFIEQIEKAKDTNTLLKIWEEMKNRSFLKYNVDIKKQDEHIEDFKQLTLKQQKEHLCEILDKNQLYVNLSSMDDKDFACTEEEKRVTKDFYGIKE